MDVGEGRELGAEALPAKCVLHLYASNHAETVCHYSEVPQRMIPPVLKCDPLTNQLILRLSIYRDGFSTMMRIVESFPLD